MANTVFHITGTSRGIGKSLVDFIVNSNLETLKVQHVYGYARSNQDTRHPSFIPCKLDLSDPKQVNDFEFPDDAEASNIVVIHNAGNLEPAGDVGTLAAKDISDSLYLAVTAPAILINKFLHKHAKTGKRLMWINISSGAAHKDLDGRSVYCTAKAAAEMFIKCCATEARVKGDTDRVRFFSIAPGVVDTDMQTVMREQGKAKGFSDVDRFIELHEKKQLVSPDYVAERLVDIVAHPDKYDVVYRIPPPS